MDVWIKEKEKEITTEEMSRDAINEMEDFVKTFDRELSKAYQKSE